MDTGPLHTGSVTLTAIPESLVQSNPAARAARAPIQPRSHYLPNAPKKSEPAGPIREAARLRRFFAGWSLGWSVAASFAILLLFWVLS